MIRYMVVVLARPIFCGVLARPILADIRLLVRLDLIAFCLYEAIKPLPFAGRWKNNSSKSSSTSQFDWPPNQVRSTGQFDWPMAIDTHISYQLR
jgi:hypothetical protein